MRVHKRKKTSRIRGARTCGWGFRQKHKGHGNKGGVGKAGSGKRADHKKQFYLEMDPQKRYFGARGATSRSTRRKKRIGITLRDIQETLFTKEGCKIDLSKKKILGTGEGLKCEITALAATKGAMEKMSKAGGKIILLKKEETSKEEKGNEKKIEDSKQKPTKKKVVKK